MSGNTAKGLGMALSPAYMIYSMFTDGPPKPKPPPQAPDPDDPNLLNQQRQKLAEAAAKGSGRQATIYSSTPDYSGSKL